MKKLTKRRPSVAFVLALVALVAALSNGAYAMATAQKNSVVSKSIKNGQVKTPDLAPKAVSTAKLKDNAVTTAQLKDGAVDAAKLKDGAVTSAKVADGSIEGDDLGARIVGSEALGEFDIVNSTSPATGDADGQTNGGQHGIAEATATCPAGSQVISGGALWTNPSSPVTVDQNVYLQSSHVYGNGWRARGVVDFGAQGTIRLRTYVLCLMPVVGN
jgi:hypothetical protein